MCLLETRLVDTVYNLWVRVEHAEHLQAVTVKHRSQFMNVGQRVCVLLFILY